MVALAQTQECAVEWCIINVKVPLDNHNNSGKKSSWWSNVEDECLLKIWADPNIQEKMDETQKNLAIFGIIHYSNLLGCNYQRTIE